MGSWCAEGSEQGAHGKGCLSVFFHVARLESCPGKRLIFPMRRMQLARPCVWLSFPWRFPIAVKQGAAIRLPLLFSAIFPSTHAQKCIKRRHCFPSTVPSTSRPYNKQGAAPAAAPVFSFHPAIMPSYHISLWKYKEISAISPSFFEKKKAAPPAAPFFLPCHTAILPHLPMEIQGKIGRAHV